MVLRWTGAGVDRRFFIDLTIILLTNLYTVNSK